jgi:hypothetical protein
VKTMKNVGMRMTMSSMMSVFRMFIISGVICRPVSGFHRRMVPSYDPVGDGVRRPIETYLSHCAPSTGFLPFCLPSRIFHQFLSALRGSPSLWLSDTPSS